MSQSYRKFILLTAFEYVVNVFASLLFSYFVGRISSSSLSTQSLANQVLSVLTAIFGMLTSGSSILCARLIGEKDTKEASRILEQTLLLAVTASVTMTLLCLAFASPIMRILMPNSEDAVFAEALSYFRVLILCFPFMEITAVLCGALRASGDPKSPLVINFSVNIFQFVFVYLFIGALKLGTIGSALTYLFCRMGGCVVSVLVLSKSHERFVVSIKNMLKPHFPSFKRILRIGCPTAVESVFVQIGYLVANAMVMGLGTYHATVYNVSYTLYNFAALPQSICSALAVTIIGQLIGAKQFKQARKTGWCIWGIGMAFSFLLSTIIMIGCPVFAKVYTQDESVLQGAVHMMWPVFFMCIPAISLNTLDPQLRVGGDVKYVMVVTIIAVWAIRLPLTYFMCYQWNMGAAGVYWANTLSLSFRAVCNMIRFCKGKYLTMRV